MKPMNWLRLGLVAGALLLLGTGCGPISSFSNTLSAQDAIKAAHDAKAWKYACYEYYMARRLLMRAKIEAGYSDFQASADYAKKARAFARRAQTNALLHSKRGSQPLQLGNVRFVNEAKGQVRVVCKLPKSMIKSYKVTKFTTPNVVHVPVVPKIKVAVRKAAPKPTKKK